ncbi:MAG: NAD-binding protein [Haloferacaceae archaeon]
MERSREWVGARASVALTGLAALLSIATGLASIGAGQTTGPLAPYVPAVVELTVSFTGTITGFLLLLSAFSLRRGYRIGWYAAVVLLPLTAAQGLLQAWTYSYPLVVLSLVALAVVLLNRRRFTTEMDVTATQLAAVSAIVGAQAYGTLGTYALREQFNGVASLTDAFYFTLVTGSTVGYGDVTPATGLARWFAMSALLLNVASFAVALGVLLTPAIEARLTKALGRMTQSQLDVYENHILVLGYGELTEPILDELREIHEADFLVITPDEATARTLRERDIEVFTADPSDDDPLQKAHIEDARAVVAATNDDAEDALAILTARQLNPQVRIVAAATHRENVRKLKRAGANTVISPATIGGRLLVRSALGQEGVEDTARRLMDEE